jgi:uncharacterized protein DUF2171
MADPVAWTMIEHGWTVRDAAGEEIGRVDEVTGDENADIFDGLSLTEGILEGKKYVPSEHVAEIYEGDIRLDLSRAEVEALQTFKEPPPEEQVLPESSTWYQRIAWRWLTGRKR